MFLFSCIKFLGVIEGFRYWRICNQILNNPEIGFEWAKRLRQKSAVEPDIQRREAYQAFADSLDEALTEYIK